MKDEYSSCKNCILQPCCTERCFVTIVYLNKGKKAAKIFADGGGWDNPEEIEETCGLKGTQYKLSDYYLQVSDDRVDAHPQYLSKLKRKKIEVVACIVHGRMYIDKVNAYILPHNRIGVNLDDLS